VTGFDPGTARRVALTVSCRDCDELPKVAGAGGVEDRSGARVQVMHNGVVVEEGGYFGAWMAEIIRCLDGHHEPQEELVFARVLERLAAEGLTSPAAVELGSFWAYYSLWFLHDFPDGTVVAMEPDPANLEVGRRNFRLNGRTGHFVHGGIGSQPGTTMTFTSEMTGQPFEVPQHDLASLMAEGGLDRVDLLMCDIQGAETLFFEQAADLIGRGLVRFAVVSTHHHRISGNPLTHQALVARMREMGAHVVAEHSVGESFSGDGLLVVSFDGRDRDLVVETSVARQGDSIFGPLEHDLALAWADRDAEKRRGDELAAALEHRTAEAARLTQALHRLEAEVGAIRATRLWRHSEGPRRTYAAWRRIMARR